jgi:hypothetical protein
MQWDMGWNGKLEIVPCREKPQRPSVRKPFAALLRALNSIAHLLCPTQQLHHLLSECTLEALSNVVRLRLARFLST